MPNYQSSVTQKKAIIHKEIDIEFYVSITEVPEAWDKLVVDSKNLFLSRDYLELVEEYPPQGISGHFLIIYRDREPIGIAYCQYLRFSFKNSFRPDGKPDGSGSKWQNNLRDWSFWLGDLYGFRLLICGSVFLTGEHGFYFKRDAVGEKEQYDLIDRGMRLLAKGLPNRANLYIVKDLSQKRPGSHDFYAGKGYGIIPWLQPSMKLEFRPEWQSFEDYLGAMSSKYRTRAKRARKKGKALQRRELFVEEIEDRSAELYDLYLAVADSVDFNIAFLHKEYFFRFKCKFPDRFRIYGYFLDDQLVGFFTTFQNETEMEAHFLGFQNKVNPSHQLYLNILYDIIALGFESGVSRIDFARTALEIKSSVGAVPVSLDTFARHTSGVMNGLLKRGLRRTGFELDWVQRHPFKEKV